MSLNILPISLYVSLMKSWCSLIPEEGVWYPGTEACVFGIHHENDGNQTQVLSKNFYLQSHLSRPKYSHLIDDICSFS